MKIAAINPTVARELEKAIIDALGPVADRYGVKIKPAGGTYTALEALLKIKVSVVSDSVVGPETLADRERFVDNANFYSRIEGYRGLKATDLDRTFQFQGRTYRVAGLKGGRAAAQVLAVRDDGRMSRFYENDVLRFLETAAREDVRGQDAL